MASDDVDNPFGDLPDNLESLIEHIGFVEVEPDTPHDEVLENYGKQGKCMTCQCKLGLDTVFVLHANGISMMFCQSACFQDMTVLHWIDEQYTDIISAVRFRGGAGDELEDDS